MLILFTVVLLGALARKLHLMNDAFDALLSKLVMTVALPGMILNSVLGNTNLPDSNTILMLLVCSTVLYFFICLFAWVFVRVVYRGVPKPAQGAHAYLISFGNTGFIGFAGWAPSWGMTPCSTALFTTFPTMSLCSRLECCLSRVQEQKAWRPKSR